MYRIDFSPPDIGSEELEEIADTIKSGWITTGPKTKKFEKLIAKYCEADGAVCLNSATACLETILRVLEIGPGDEVITSAYTYTASASPVCHVGAKLVLVDIEKDSLEMDYKKLEEAITKNTKAIIPIDIGGVLCDYEKIFSIVEEKKYLFKPETELQKSIGRVAVIADSAHGFGAVRNGQKSGSIADFTSFSFHAVKNLTTAEGGALTWKTFKGIDNKELYSKFMMLTLHGQSKDALEKSKLGAWEYDIVSTAYKCNMTDIMAAIGIVQLKRYPDMLNRRKKIIKIYENEVKKIGINTLDHFTKYSSSSGHLFIMNLPWITESDRNKIIEKMAQKGVATNVHYKPLPMMTAYKNMGFDIKDYPNAYNYYKGEISLPLHTKLKDEEVEYILDVFMEILKCF